MRLALALLIWLTALPALAQAITVKSGEHPGFSRLVLDLPAQTEWVLGRAGAGYALRLAAPARIFDLSQVYGLIPRTRLASIWADPGSGELRLGVGCACHAVAFRFRPDVLVIDLRDGPPPDGSSFELALDGSPAPALESRPQPRPRARPETPEPDQDQPDYDWIAASRSVREPSNATAPLVPEPRALQDLRSALLMEVSRGVADGIVERTGQLPPLQLRAGPLVQVRIGPEPGMAAAIRPTGNRLVASGAACIADDRLDIAAWGGEGPMAEQFAVARQGLAGEFDTPQPEAIARAVRFHLQAGFGAEAAVLLQAFGGTGDDEALWTSMARIVDGGLDPEGAFAGMETCDTAAALWAVLANGAVPPGSQTNRQAVRRAFSALPVPLRHHLGPILSERYLAAGDAETARALRDAVLRAQTGPDPQTDLMSAALDLAEGDVAGAEAQLQALVDRSGPATTEALLTLVESRIVAASPVDAPTVTALASLLHEYGGTPQEPRVRRAHLLAQGLSGDFDGAFAALPAMPEAEADLHRILADAGPDSAVLAHGVRSQANVLPDLPTSVRRKLAARLTALGLGDAALVWLTADPDAPDALVAEAELQRGDPSAALRALAEDQSPEAAALRATAQQRLGLSAAAAATLAAAGASEAADRARIGAGDWNAVADGDDGSAWTAAARLVTGAQAPHADLGPLARSAALIAESAAARATLRTLLSGVSAPKLR